MMATVTFFIVVEQLVLSFTDTVALTGSDSVGIVKLRLTTVFDLGNVMTSDAVLMISAEKHTHVQKLCSVHMACNVMNPSKSNEL